MNPKTIAGIAALFLALGVMLGAFGAHALKSRLPADMLEVWHTAVLYHLVHALALLAIAALAASLPEISFRAPVVLLMVGMLLFSGSLYALAVSGIRPLGAITPFGGAAFILGWLWLAWACLRG